MLLVLAIAFVGIGFVEYASRELLLNPKVISSNQFESYFRVNSLFFDPNIYGRFLVVVMLGLVAVLLWSRRSALVAGCAVALALLWAGLVLTLSQSSFTALLGGLAVLGGLRWGASKAVAAVAVVAVAGALVALAAPGAVGLDQSADDVTSGRSTLVRGGVELVTGRPLHGLGRGSLQDEYRRQREGLERSARRRRRTRSRSRSRPSRASAAWRSTSRSSSSRSWAAARRASSSRAPRSRRRSWRSSCTRCCTPRSSRIRWRGRCWRSGRRWRRRPRAGPRWRPRRGHPRRRSALRTRPARERAVPRRDRAGVGDGRRAGARRRRRRGRSSRRIPTTTPTTTSSGAATCWTARRPASRPSPRRRSTRCTSRLGALLALAGEHADRLLVLVTILSLVALDRAATFALGRALFGARPAAAGALFVGSSFAFLLYAVRAFVDVPFLALVVWAAALEARATAARRWLPMALLARGRAAAPGGVGARGAVLAVVPARPRTRARDGAARARAGRARRAGRSSTSPSPATRCSA